MKLQRMNVRSTKKIEETDKPGETNSPMPKKEDVYTYVFNAHDTVYTDQTGGFPITLSRGNKYIMVMCEVDGNYIDAEPMKTRTAECMIQTYLTLWNRLTSSKVITPKLHILDNEAPEALREVIRSHCKMQLVPPDTHRSNLAERAIQTFKNHFIAILSGVDKSFPMHLWDRLIPQAVLTLNLLRQSHANPNVSAYHYVNGPFDYNATPLGPMGCAVQIFNSPERRKSWEERSLDGWYLGTSLDHYRCHRVYVKNSKDERISNTINFKHRYITQPTVTPVDMAIKAIEHLTKALKITKDESDEFAALKRLENIVTNKLTNTSENPATNPERPPRVQTKPVDAPAFNTRTSAARTDFEMVMLIVENTNKMLPQSQATHEHANLAILHPDTGRQMTYRQLMTHPDFKDSWNHSSANEFGRLAQGIGGRIKGTDTIRFVRKEEIPPERFKDITYGKFVCEEKPNKAEVHRTRLTVGGDKVNYPYEVGTPTAEMLLVKTHLNSVISTPDARYMTLDISNFYLNTPMIRPEYLRLKLEDIPEEVIVEYNLREKATLDGYVYVEVKKAMYGLPQAGLLAQELLEKRLNEHGYTQSEIIPGLWKHKTNSITFTLVVDDFGVKYIAKEDVQNLVNILKQNYQITEDWTGSKYIGLTLDWDYKNRKVHLSMPGYIQKTLECFNHTTPTKPQNSPYPHTRPEYGAKVQYAVSADTTPILGKNEKKFIQQVTGTLLYYARAVDPTMLTALSAIASQQAAPTQATMDKVNQLLDYAASQEDAIITYQASDMVLAVHSDAGYLNEPNAKSRAGGHFYLSSNEKFPPNNGAILNIAQVIKAVMSSAAEAELGALFINAKEAIHIRNMLEIMGYPQLQTPIQTDNSTAEGVINNKIQPKRTKAMDMRFNWLQCRKAQEQFRFFWRPGEQNLADYWTKHHPASHHQNVRSEFLTKVQELKELRQGSIIESAHMSLAGSQDASCKGVLDRASIRPDSSWNFSRQDLKSAISNVRFEICDFKRTRNQQH